MEKKINVVLVDENDKEIWEEEKMLVHENWYLHRAISVIIMNNNWEMLLQQRALDKYHCWGLWSNATCTHPYKNEENADAAHRRLQEELGFDTELKEIFQFTYMSEFQNWLIEHEFDHVFLGYYDWKVNFNKSEVNDYKWIVYEELLQDLVKNEKNYTEWFKIMMNILIKGNVL